MYDIIHDRLSFFSRAIGHPARVAILLEIAKRGKVMEGEQLNIADLSPSTVIQHLRELKRAGLIKGRIFGARSRYELDMDNIKHFMANSEEFFASIGKE